MDAGSMHYSNSCAVPQRTALPIASQLPGAASNSQSKTISQKSAAVSEIVDNFKTSVLGKKLPRTARQDVDADDACPVAVYVDLSVLKETRPLGRAGLSML